MPKARQKSLFLLFSPIFVVALAQYKESITNYAWEVLERFGEYEKSKYAYKSLLDHSKTIWGEVYNVTGKYKRFFYLFSVKLPSLVCLEL